VHCGTPGEKGESLLSQVHPELHLRICFDGGEDLFQEFRGDHHGQKAVVQGIIFEDVCKKTADHHPEAIIIECPGGMLAARTTPEILARHQDLPPVAAVIEHKLRLRFPSTVITPVPEQILPETLALDRLQKHGGNDLVGIYILHVERNRSANQNIKGVVHNSLKS